MERAQRIRADPAARALRRRSSLGEDLVFEEAQAIAGGREFMQSRRQARARAASPTRQQQLPGPLHHPPPVDRRGRLRGAAARRVGRSTGRPCNAQVAAQRRPQARSVRSRGASLGSFVTKESQALLGVPVNRLVERSGRGEQAGVQPDPGGDSGQRRARARAEPRPEAATPRTRAKGAGCRCALGDSPVGGIGFGLLALSILAGVRAARAHTLDCAANPTTKLSARARTSARLRTPS